MILRDHLASNSARYWRLNEIEAIRAYLPFHPPEDPEEAAQQLAWQRQLAKLLNREKLVKARYLRRMQKKYVPMSL